MALPDTLECIVPWNEKSPVLTVQGKINWISGRVKSVITHTITTVRVGNHQTAWNLK